MSRTLRRRSQLLWALIGSLVLMLSALTLGGVAFAGIGMMPLR